jgi:hypothetical protein
LFKDDYAITSYQRAQAAFADGCYADEIVPITVSGGKGKPDKVITQDDEISNVRIKFYFIFIYICICILFLKKNFLS